MKNLFAKVNISQVILNLATILIVAAMLFVNCVIASPDNTAAAPNMSTDVLSYQGTLVDSSGNPVTGDQDMTFRIYNHATDPTPLWEEAHTGTNAVPVQNGLFNVMLGSLNPIPDSVWDEAELYLGIQMGAEAEMTPREVINLLPPQIAPGSLNPDVLVPQALTYDAFPTYYITYGSQGLMFFDNVGGTQTNLEPNSCADESWCCNAEDNICLYKSTTDPARLALKMNSSHSIACWLVHAEDDNPNNNIGLTYATDDGGNGTPFVTDGHVFYLSRSSSSGIPIVGYTAYIVVCFK